MIKIFVDFLCSDRDQTSIHVESGNIFYQNFNTNENFYSFLLAQQDETNSVVPKRIFYSYSFEKFYLPSFSIDDAEKYDLYSNKNAKYLFYKFNDWIESQDLLSIFQMLYYHYGRLPFTNGLIIVPDGEVPDGMEKINLKSLYQMFNDTKSHEIVSLHFFGSLGIFFGLRPSIPKYALTELCQNLYY